MASELEKVLDAGFDAVKGYVDRGFDSVFARLAAAEARLAKIDGGTAPSTATDITMDRLAARLTRSMMANDNRKADG